MLKKPLPVSLFRQSVRMVTRCSLAGTRRRLNHEGHGDHEEINWQRNNLVGSTFDTNRLLSRIFIVANVARPILGFTNDQNRSAAPKFYSKGILTN